MKVLNFIRTLFSFSKTKKLLEASSMLHNAIEEAERLRLEDGKRRFVFFDPAQRKLITLTYFMRKGYGDSYQYLRRRGRFTKPMKYEEFREKAYYYTGSKNGAPAISQEELKKRTLRWQQDYLHMKR